MSETRLELVRQLRSTISVARGLAYRVRAAIEAAYDEGSVQYGEVQDIRSATSRIIAADGSIGYLLRTEEKLAKRDPQGVIAEAVPDSGED